MATGILVMASPVVHSLFLPTVAIWLVLEFRQAQRQRPGAVPADAGSRIVLRLCYVAGFGVAFVLTERVPSAQLGVAAAPWAGLLLIWSGISIRAWSFQTLGRYFTFTVQTSDDQPVISSGPYRIIRHPGYAGVLLASMGTGMVTGNWLAILVITVAVLCGLIYRITVEERALSRALGAAYQSYAWKRRRLIPYIW